MSIRNKNGKWMPAVNLGDSINTAGDEMAPFLHADNQTLYFSSNGRPGMGGFDLYVSRKDSSGKWSSPSNLGYPINTKADELNLFAAMDGQYAWISSNRNGNMDIYQFELFKKIQPQKTFFIKGTVIDNQTGEPLQAKVILTNLSTSKNIDSTWSSAADGHFLLVLHPGKELAFHILKKNYLFYSKHFTFEDTTDRHAVSAVFKLKPIQKNSTMQLENILFDFDSYTLRQEAYPELNLLTRLLKANPSVDILIAGYTDATGSQAYNQKLSTRRAKAVYDYLVSRGIDDKRLEYKGYGAVQIPNDKASPALRAKNRRTEIIIR
jgi:outer membrane protein OmpA-like peptidoglycan-associated protein